MGFEDYAKNLDLLESMGGHIEQVIEAILA